MIKKMKRKPMKDCFYDKNTVWEMQNIDVVCYTLMARYGIAESEEELSQQLHEYLTERGVKVYEGMIYDIYYREDDELYNEYEKYCKKTSQEQLPKQLFFSIYAQTLHEDMEKRHKTI